MDDYTDLVRDIQLDPGNSRYAWHTRRREMENYLPMESIEAEFGISLADYAEGWYERDVPHLLHGLCMLNIRDSHKREVAIKGRLNNSITKKLTKADLESIDAWEEIELWFRKIRAIVDGTYVEQTHD